jgi:SH3 domain-containing YSC84-like protein 1
MKKLLLLSLLALFGAASARADRAEYVTRIETCEAILQEFMANPETAIPPQVLERARGLVIVNQVRAGLLFGVKDGYGVIMVKKADGRWSLPVLVAAGELSLGLQVGINASESVMVITNDATPRLLYDDKFRVGVDANAIAGPHAAEAEKFTKELLETPVLVYTKSRGLYAGATVKTGWLQRADPANFILYGTQYTMPELLYSDWVQPVPEVVPLMNLVQKLAP